MTPCTRCATPLAGDDLRCPTCGALAPVPEPAWRDDDRTRVDAPTDAPPWSIPIREPSSPSPPSPAESDGGGGDRPGVLRAGALVLLALVVFLGTVAIGARFLSGDDDGGGGPVGGALATPGESSGLDARSIRTDGDDGATTDAAGSPVTDGEGEDDDAAASSSTTTTSTTVAPSTTAAPTTTSPPPDTGSVPALPASFRGGWVAQLTSVPYSAGTDRLEAAWEVARDGAPGAVATRSDEWSSLRDGFWVLVDPGPFASADDVQAFCATTGLDDCLPRALDGRR